MASRMSRSDTAVPLTSMKRWMPCECLNGAASLVSGPPRRRGGTAFGALSGDPVTVVVAVISVPDARVDHGVDDVDYEADHDDDQREERNQALHPDVVAVVEVLQQSAAQTGPAEGLLGQHGAAEQQRGLQAHHRHDRDQGVAE